MIHQFDRIIGRLATPLVYHTVTQSTASGELTESYASGVSSMAPLSMTPAFLKYQTDGAFDVNDKKFYQAGTLLLPNRSVIEYDGDYFRIEKIIDRRREGNFVEYLAKRIKASEMES